MATIGYFQEDNGSKSITRVFFAIGLSWAMMITTYGVIGVHWSAGETIAVFSALSGVFVALKLGQKPMENKPVNPVKEEIITEPTITPTP